MTKNIEKAKSLELNPENLNQEVLEKIAPNYKNDIKKLYSKEKTEFINLVNSAQKVLGKKTLEILLGSPKFKKVPFENMEWFLSELVNTERKKNLLQTAQVILTQKELDELEKILTENTTKENLNKLKKENLNKLKKENLNKLKKENLNKLKKENLNKLKEFVEIQTSENITSAQLIKNTPLAEKLKQLGENPSSFMKGVDNVWYNFLLTEKLNISKDSIRNMATGITLFVIQILEKSKGKIIPINQLTNPYYLGSLLIKNKSILEKINNLVDIIKKLNGGEDSESNEILTNPEKFKELLNQYIFGNLSKEQVKETIEKAQKNQKILVNPKKIKEANLETFEKVSQYINQKNIKEFKSFSKFGNQLEKLKEGFKNIKEQFQEKAYQYFPVLAQVKEFCLSISPKFWDFVKQIIEVFLKLIGFKNWNDYETKSLAQKFPNLLKGLKQITKLENIKKEKNSIFYKAFEKQLNKISAIKINGHLSYESLSFLKSKFNINNPKQAQKELLQFFSNQSFEKVLQKANLKTEDFFKKAFKVEKQTKDNKDILIGEIKFDYIDQVIQTAFAQEINNSQKKEEQKNNAILTIYNSNENIKNPNIPENLANKVNQSVETSFHIPFNYKKFTYAIAQIESSRGDYKAINPKSGALGKYQFMPNTLLDYKKTICLNKNCSQEQIKENFLNNPKTQESVMAKYTKSHIIQIYNKCKAGDIKCPTTEGELVKMLAKAHFTGIGNLNKNKSDGKMKADDYAQKAGNNYEAA